MVFVEGKPVVSRNQWCQGPCEFADGPKVFRLLTYETEREPQKWQLGGSEGCPTWPHGTGQVHLTPLLRTNRPAELERGTVPRLRAAFAVSFPPSGLEVGGVSLKTCVFYFTLHSSSKSF